MKYLTFVSSLLLLILTSNCESLDNLTQFNLEYSSSVTIPPTTGLNLPLNLFTPEMETDSESEFAIHNTNKDLIEEINLTEMMMTITSPNNQRFDFLNEISVYINAEGLSELKIAEAKDIPENIENELNLNTLENDLSEYIKKDKFSLRVNTITDKLISQEIDINVFSNFFVDAQIIL